MQEDARREALKRIKDEVLALSESPLYEYRTKNHYFPVIGEGNHYAKLMFVGEAPGRTEAQTGRPFVGAAGRVLEELLESVGMNRTEVYIANILKDRPPENRDPLPEEITVYGPFLDRQIEIIQPSIIATLGRYSLGYIMRKFEMELYLQPISSMHGKSFLAKAPYGEVSIVCLYHPAVAVYNNGMKDTLKKDFQIIKTLIT